MIRGRRRTSSRLRFFARWNTTSTLGRIFIAIVVCAIAPLLFSSIGIPSPWLVPGSPSTANRSPQGTAAPVTADDVIGNSSVIGSVPVVGHPGAPAFDSGNGMVYVPDYDNVTLVSGIGVVTSIPLYPYPEAIDPIAASFDAADGYVYIVNGWEGCTDCDPGNITVISGTSIIGWIPFSHPTAAVYDPVNELEYVATSNDNVSLIDGTTITASVPVGSDPGYAAVDSSNGWVYVTNVGSDNVSVINGTSVVGSITGFDDPTGVSFDPTDGLVYVANYQTGTISVIEGLTVVSSIDLESAFAPTAKISAIT